MAISYTTPKGAAELVRGEWSWPDRDAMMLSDMHASDDVWYEATPAMQGIWALDRIEQLRPAYMIPSVLEFTGPIDHELLVAAIRQALCRHPAMRAKFRLNVKFRRVEYSTVGEPPEVRFWEVGSDLPGEDLKRFIDDFCYSPFDLAAGPLARAEVIRVDGVTTILVLTVHHIVFDGWSRRLLMAEIAQTYQAALQGLQARLDESAHPAKVLVPAPESEKTARIEAVVERLRGAPIGVALPYDHFLPADDSPLVSAVASTQFDAELTGRVMAAATREGCTAFMLAVALLAGTLARNRKQRDFLFAVVWPGRDDPASRDVVGMFMNTVVLRVALEKRTTWRELLRSARAGALEAFVDADVPLSAVAAELDKKRDMSRQPLTPVLINLADAPSEFELAPGVRSRYRQLDVMYSKWDLALLVHQDQSPGAERLDLSFDYPVQLFERTTICGLLSALRRSAIDLINHAEEPVLESSAEIDLNNPAVRIELVRSAWREVLGEHEIDDDIGFFDAGGDSLLLVALVEQLSKTSGQTLKTMDVFRASSINGQAELLAHCAVKLTDGSAEGSGNDG
jgi:hypothetical protein